MSNSDQALSLIKLNTNSKSQIVSKIAPNNNIIAYYDPNEQSLKIIQSSGHLIISIVFKETIKDLQFSNDSNYLGIMTSNSVKIISSYNKWNGNQTEINLDKRIPQSISWNNTNILAIGNDNGSIIFYNLNENKQVFTVGKHTNKVQYMTWNKDNILLSYSEEKKITISYQNSETHKCTKEQGSYLLNDFYNPIWMENLKFKKDKNSTTVNYLKNGLNFLSAVNERKALLLVNLNSKETPKKISLNQNYGKIIDFDYLIDGRIIVAFSKGTIVILDIYNEDLQEEIDNERIFSSSIERMVIDKLNNKIYCFGDSQLKVIQVRKLKELKSQNKKFNPQEGICLKVQLSSNGQFFSRYTNANYFEILFFQLDKKIVSSKNFIVQSVSMNELKVNFLYENIRYDNWENYDLDRFQYSIQSEDNFTDYSLCKNYLLCFRGEKFLIFELRMKNYQLIWESQVQSEIFKVINDDKNNFIILQDKQISILNILQQKIEKYQNNSISKQNDLKSDQQFVYLGLGKELIMIDIFSGKQIYSKNFDFDLKKIFLNKNLFFLILVTNDDNLFYFSPENEEILQINESPLKTQEIIFSEDQPQQILLKQDDGKLIVFLSQIKHYQNDIKIEMVKEYENFEQFEQKKGTYFDFFNEKDFQIMNFINGMIYGIDKNQRKLIFILDTHSYKLEEQRNKLIKKQSKETIGRSDQTLDFQDEIIEKQFFQCLALKNFKDAFKIVLKMCEEDQQSYFQKLSNYSLEYLDLETSIKCLQKLNKMSEALQVQQISYNNDQDIFKGQIAIMFQQNEKALEMLLKGNKPQLAIKLLKSNHKFKQALELSKKFELEENYAELLIDIADEHYLKDEFLKSQSYYEQVLKQKVLNLKEQEKAMIGIAKIYLKQGNFAKIPQILENVQNRSSLEEFGDGAMQNQSFQIAIELFKKLNNFEKTLICYLKWVKISPSCEPQLNDYLQQNLSKITSKQLLLEIGLFYESINQYEEAEQLYLRSENFVELIKLYLFKTNQSQKAEKYFHENCQKSQTAANYLAEYHSEISGNKEKSIEYYVMAGRRFEAFQKAKEDDLIEIYCKYVDKIDEKESFMIANYLEQKKQYLQSGVYFEKCNEIEKALINFIKGEAYEKAIDLVIKVKNDELVDYLIQIFAGNISVWNENQTQQIVEPIYLFRLYLNFQRYEDANQVALIIVDKEAECGKYGLAHQKIQQMVQKISEKDPSQISFELRNKLIIYHSYILAKKLLKISEHENAGHLLYKICQYINYFPKHSVQIMTSAVIECTKARQKYFAYILAVELCKPDNRNQIQEKLKTKIEKIALKAVNENNYSTNKKCPICNMVIQNDYEDQCKGCKNNFLICYASGLSILKEDQKFNILQCCNCKGLMYQQKLDKILKVEKNCPLCQEEYFSRNFTEVSWNEIKNIMC